MAHRALQSLRAEKERWPKATKQLEGVPAANEEAERCKGVVRRLTAEVQQHRKVKNQLREPENARQVFATKLYEARAEAPFYALLLQRAADFEVHLADAKGLIAELKVRLSEQEATTGEGRAKTSTKFFEGSEGSKFFSPMHSPSPRSEDEPAPIYYTVA